MALTGEPGAIAPPPGGESFDAFYMPLTGTSMAAPALTGAVAVVQSAARARLGRLLTPAEVEQVVTGSAQPMTGTDGLWDFPCPDCPDRVRERGSGPGVHGRALRAVAGGRGIPRRGGGRGGRSGHAGAGRNRLRGDWLAPRCRRRLRGPLPAARRAEARARPRHPAGSCVIRGLAADRGCGPAGSGAMGRVRVAIARGTGRGQCRFAGPRGRLGASRSCRRRRYLPAEGRRLVAPGGGGPAAGPLPRLGPRRRRCGQRRCARRPAAFAQAPLTEGCPP